MLVVIAGLVSSLTAVQIRSQKNFFQERLQNLRALERSHFDSWTEGIVATLSSQVENSLASYNFSLLTLLLEEAISSDDNFIYAIVYNSEGKAVFSKGQANTLKQALLSPWPQQGQGREIHFTGQVKHIQERRQLIQISTVPWGELRLGFSLDGLDNKMAKARSQVQEQIRQMITRSIVVALLFVVVSTMLAIYVTSRITQRLARLTNIAHELSRGNFQAGVELRPSAHDEVGVLAEAFSEMSERLQESHDQIAQYSHSLEQQVDERTRELNAAYHELKESQNQLIQAEKMASLGQLVGGVAHEINTPIGIGVTAATHLEEATQRLGREFSQQTMTKASLEKYLGKSGEAVHLILSNLQRTSELVANFKQVSVDQASHEKRRFKLKEYIDSIIVSLGPRLRKSPVAIEVNCDETITLNSYPGAFAQVLTNLIINSLTHGFEQGQPGQITIEARQQDKRVNLFFHDNGYGISQAHLDQIFDPFFTTKRGEGGSGLGLHIVYNIMTQTMDGTIFCESEEGKGTTFILNLPLDVE